MPHLQMKPYFNTPIPPLRWDFLSLQKQEKTRVLATNRNNHDNSGKFNPN